MKMRPFVTQKLANATLGGHTFQKVMVGARLHASPSTAAQIIAKSASSNHGALEHSGALPHFLVHFCRTFVLLGPRPLALEPLVDLQSTSARA